MRSTLATAVRDGDCGRLEEALRKARPLLGETDPQVCEGNDVAANWRAQCGPARTELLAAIKERRDLPKLVEAVQRAEQHPRTTLMRSDVRRAKNVVVITEEAMRAIKPALDSTDVAVVDGFLQQYASVLPQEVFHEVTTLRDSYSRSRTSRSPHTASPSPASPASPRSASLSANFEGNFKGYVNTDNMHVSGVIEGKLKDGDLTRLITSLSPRRKGEEEGVTGFEPSPRRSRHGPGSSAPLRTPLPPKTPDSAYFPGSAMRSTSSYSASPAAAAAMPAPNPPPAAHHTPSPQMFKAIPRSVSRDANGGTFRQVGFSPHHRHTTSLPRRGEPSAVSVRSRTVSTSIDEARHTERLRLYLQEINSREKHMREERRACQHILKEMVGDLSVSKTLRLPVTTQSPRNPAYIEVHSNLIHAKPLPEEEEAMRREQQAHFEEARRVRRRALEEDTRLLAAEQMLEYETIVRHEADAVVMILKKYELGINQVLLFCRIREDVANLEHRNRNDIVQDEALLWDELEETLTFRKDQAAYAENRVSQFEHEDVRIKTMEAKLAALLTPRIEQHLGDFKRDLCDRLEGIEQSLSPTHAATTSSTSAQPAAGTTSAPSATSPTGDSDLHRLFVSLAAAEKRAEEAEVSLREANLALQEKQGALQSAASARDVAERDAASMREQISSGAHTADLTGLQTEVDRLKSEADEMAAFKETMEEEKRALIAKLDAEKKDLGRQLEEISQSHSSRVEEKHVLLRELEQERAARKELQENQIQHDAEKTEFAQLKADLMEARNELAKLHKGERDMPSRDDFLRGAMRMLMDEQEGRYAMWKDEFCKSQTTEFENYRELMALSNTMTLHLSEVQEPSARTFVMDDALEGLSEIEKHPVVLRLFEMIAEGVGSESESEG